MVWYFFCWFKENFIIQLEIRVAYQTSVHNILGWNLLNFKNMQLVDWPSSWKMNACPIIRPINSFHLLVIDAHLFFICFIHSSKNISSRQNISGIPLVEETGMIWLFSILQSSTFLIKCWVSISVIFLL